MPVPGRKGIAMDNKNNQKKKKGGGGALLVFLLIFLLPRLLEALENSNFERQFSRAIWQMQRWLIQLGLDPDLLPLLFVAVLVLIAVVITSAKKAAKKRDAEQGSTKAYTSAGRTTAATRRPDPRNRSFTPPEPSCIVCDHTGEDHFVRDKQQRIAQLDEWLKNGLIAREEYKVLKSRYERDL